MVSMFRHHLICMVDLVHSAVAQSPEPSLQMQQCQCCSAAPVFSCLMLSQFINIVRVDDYAG